MIHTLDDFVLCCSLVFKYLISLPGRDESTDHHCFGLDGVLCIRVAFFSGVCLNLVEADSVM